MTRAARALRRLTVNTTLLLAAAALGVALLAVGGLALNTERRNNDLGRVLREVQQSRFDATLSNCIATNNEHRTLVAFVTAAAPELASRARLAFPVTRDCVAYARTRVH